MSKRLTLRGFTERYLRPPMPDHCPECGARQDDERFVNPPLIDVTTVQDSFMVRRVRCIVCHHEWLRQRSRTLPSEADRA